MNITSKTDNLYLIPMLPYQTLYVYEIQGHFPKWKPKIVLDLGCGTGILSIAAAKLGGKNPRA